MRGNFFVFIAAQLVLTACQKDFHTGCDGREGRVCQSAHYVEGALIRTVDYAYPSEYQTKKISKDKRGRKVASEELTYENQRLVAREVVYEGEEARLREVYEYEQGVLKTFSQEGRGVSIKLEQEVMDSLPQSSHLFLNGELNYRTETEYAMGDTTKLRTFFYDPAGNLDSLQEFRWYGTQYHITRYDGQGEVTASEIQFYEQGKLVRKRVVTPLYEDEHSWTYLQGLLVEYRVEREGKEIYLETLFYP